MPIQTPLDGLLKSIKSVPSCSISRSQSEPGFPGPIAPRRKEQPEYFPVTPDCSSVQRRAADFIGEANHDGTVTKPEPVQPTAEFLHHPHFEILGAILHVDFSANWVLCT